jgi:hypothetical protein
LGPSLGARSILVCGRPAVLGVRDSSTTSTPTYMHVSSCMCVDKIMICLYIRNVQHCWVVELNFMFD